MSDTRSDSESVAEISYLTLPVDSFDQATSLANYLNAHGVEASPDGSDGVTCPLTDHRLVEDISQLRRSWRRFWNHSDSEVFGLSVYVKPAHAPACNSDRP